MPRQLVQDSENKKSLITQAKVILLIEAQVRDSLRNAQLRGSLFFVKKMLAPDPAMKEILKCPRKYC